METTLNNRDKATYLAFALGEAMKNSLSIMMHELKVGDKEDQKLYKAKIKDQVKLYQAMTKMFPNAKKFLSEKDVQKLNDAVGNLVDGLWI